MTIITAVTRLLGPGGLSLGEPTTAGALTIVPVSHNAPIADYRRFADLAPGGLVTVEEVGFAGSVPDLRVTNRSDHDILFLEGEVLIGLKQDRTLNVTVLVAAQSTVSIPVACVEAGRWGSVSSTASPAEFHMGPSIRERKSRAVHRNSRMSGQMRSDQAEVWRSIDEEMARHEASSPTRAYRELHEQRRAEIVGLVGSMRPVDGQRGILALIGTRPVALDLFDRPETLTGTFDALVRSYAGDALVSQRPAEERHVKEALDRIHALAEGEASEHPGVGKGGIVQITSDRAVASALVVDEAVVHLAGLWNAQPSPRSTSRTRIQRPSRRTSWFNQPSGGAR